jgi:carbon starvation protein CstA
MVTFILSLALLVAAYFTYGRYVERLMGCDPKRVTPAFTKTDGVDFVPMSTPKIFLIQFLNIAGLGPIFGAVLGAAYGPVAFVWITVGCIFIGAVHDYASGMMSIRHNGASIPEIVGKYLGRNFMQLMRGFTLVLMIIVGAVFIVGPAGILASLTPESLNKTFWVWCVFVYYILATLLPIDKLIGRIYPVFGLALLIMALGITGALFFEGYHIPELQLSTLANLKSNPEAFPLFPMLFVTIACGAVSGFHSTQSPLMARCLKNERYGRPVFFGAMVTEGIVALIWAAIGMAFFGGVGALNDNLASHGNDAAYVVNLISNTTLGKVGGVLAILGVVAAPITSGDTAFRSARLIVADFLKMEQKSIYKRLIISIPLFVVGFGLTQFDFSIIWRYMAWSNQTLAAIVLWSITVYFAQNRKPYLLVLIPAIFMTAVTATYILIAPEGLRLSNELGYAIGLSLTAAISAMMYVRFIRASVVTAILEPMPVPEEKKHTTAAR